MSLTKVRGTASAHAKESQDVDETASPAAVAKELPGVAVKESRDAEEKASQDVATTA